MTTRNDITGDRLVNTPKKSPELQSGKQLEFDFGLPEFKVYECSNCHIKVSTSNGKCPCCGNKLD